MDRPGILPSHFVIKFITWFFEIITFCFGFTNISPLIEPWKVVDDISLEKKKHFWIKMEMSHFIIVKTFYQLFRNILQLVLHFPFLIPIQLSETGFSSINTGYQIIFKLSINHPKIYKPSMNWVKSKTFCRIWDMMTFCLRNATCLPWRVNTSQI